MLYIFLWWGCLVWWFRCFGSVFLFLCGGLLEFEVGGLRFEAGCAGRWFGICLGFGFPGFAGGGFRVEWFGSLVIWMPV